MGKATIISETGAGLYTIKPIYETTLLDSEITRLENEITQYTSQLSTVDTQLSTIQTEYDSKQSQLSSAINTYRAELQINPATANIEPVNALVLELNEVYIRLTAKQREKAIYTLKKVSAEKRKTKLEAVKAETVNQSAWCVTYTADLTGEVDTIEINGEPDQILIDTTNSMSDSKLCPILGQTVAGSLFNFSLTPFWQKWKPTFRNGTITSITGDTANVSLDAANSHYQALGINQSSTLSNVPIVYLSCNGAAFTTGDDVVVAFIGQDWSVPRIIGFQDNPRPCLSSGDITFTFSSQRHCYQMDSRCFNEIRLSGSCYNETTYLTDGVGPSLWANPASVLWYGPGTNTICEDTESDWGLGGPTYTIGVVSSGSPDVAAVQGSYYFIWYIQDYYATSALTISIGDIFGESYSAVISMQDDGTNYIFEITLNGHFSPIDPVPPCMGESACRVTFSAGSLGPVGQYTISGVSLVGTNYEYDIGDTIRITKPNSGISEYYYTFDIAFDCRYWADSIVDLLSDAPGETDSGEFYSRETYTARVILDLNDFI